MTAANNIERVGLKRHLEASKQEHNGYGYDEFVLMRYSKVNKVNLARIFGVDRKTIDRWVEVLAKEQAND